jgi:hypothetical protein
MLGWRWPRPRIGGALLVAAALGLLLLVARIHACACTGGPPEWTPVAMQAPVGNDDHSKAGSIAGREGHGWLSAWFDQAG